jgi:hypothetical protein
MKIHVKSKTQVKYLWVESWEVGWLIEVTKRIPQKLAQQSSQNEVQNTRTRHDVQNNSHLQGSKPLPRSAAPGNFDVPLLLTPNADAQLKADGKGKVKKGKLLSWRSGGKGTG